MATKTRVAQQNIGEDGLLTVKIYGDGEPGKQEVTGSFEVTPTQLAALPDNIKGMLLAKGYGAYLAGRYSASGEVNEDHTTLWGEMTSGTFTPTKASTAQPSAFHEAVAQVLNKPVHLIAEQMKSFTKAQTMGLRKHPKVAAAVAKIEEARAKAAGAAAKAQKGGVDINALFGIAAE